MVHYSLRSLLTCCLTQYFSLTIPDAAHDRLIISSRNGSVNHCITLSWSGSRWILCNVGLHMGIHCPSQRTMCTHIHTYRQSTCWHVGEPEREPEGHRDTMRNTDRTASSELIQGPWSCEVAMLPTARHLLFPLKHAACGTIY